MYEDRRERFSFKSFFLTILLVLLFVFLMLWLFPTKWDVNKLQSTYDLERLSVLYDEVFANNVARMKDAAIGYYTNERLPQKIGESKKLTLQQMYDLHLVLKMKDIDGNACDVNKSYVEMTKYAEEYRLKVNLSCGDVEDYIIVYLGCYSYCSDGICEKQVATSTNSVKKPEQKPTQQQVKPTSKPEAKPDPTPKPEVKPDPTPIVKKYMYEYKLVVSDKTTCTGWSSWGKTKITATDTIKVETKKENEIVNYRIDKVKVGTKTEQVVTGQKQEKYIAGYVTKLVVVDTKKVQVGTTTKETTEKVQVGTVEKFVGIGSGSVVPKNTSTRVYKNVSVDTSTSCSNCANETIYTWEIWSIEPVYEVRTKTTTVPVYKTINVYEQKEVPIYDYRTVDVVETITKDVYKDIKVPVYGDVTYYRQKTCTFVKGYIDIKWSNSNKDASLIGKGYKLTGNVKEV